MKNILNKQATTQRASFTTKGTKNNTGVNPLTAHRLSNASESQNANHEKAIRM